MDNYSLKKMYKAYTSYKKSSFLFLTLILLSTVIFENIGISQTAPYPPSSIIIGLQFNLSTIIERASGSDNWAITWADDDHQYATWGDGGGFGGTNNDGRVSLGVARIEGSTTHHRSNRSARRCTLWLNGTQYRHPAPADSGGTGSRRCCQRQE